MSIYADSGVKRLTDQMIEAQKMILKLEARLALLETRLSQAPTTSDEKIDRRTRAWKIANSLR